MTLAPATLLDDATALQDDLVRLRRDLHRDPELGLSLPRTQEKVLAALDGLPLDITLGSDGLSSVTAVLRGTAEAPAGRERPAVLLRGDMDALPVRETTGFDFACDDERMHACGHDLHTSMLAGAAQLLSARRDALAGDVVFMFQPGEEGYDGARHMVSAGVLDAAGRRVDAAYALHVMSAVLPSGLVACRPGTMMSAADVLHVTVRGRGGHGSMPHNAADPVQVAAEMVVALQAFVTRRFNIFDPVVITVGEFHAGTQHNIIPETARFEATVRSFSVEAHERVMAGTVQVCEGIAAAHGVEVDAVCESLYPVTVNAESGYEHMRSVTSELFGEDRFVTLPDPIPGSEDFSRVLDAVPGAMAFLGATLPDRDPFAAPANHAPGAAYDEAVLGPGAALYAALAATALR